MAHVGQELRLGPRRGFRSNAGGQQFAVGLRQFVLQMLGAQRRAQAGPQLACLEGLRQVINRAQLKPAQLVAGAVPGGQDNDRDGLRFGRLLKLPQQFEPVDARQAKVQHDQIELLRARQSQGGGRVAGSGDGYVFVMQQTG